MVAFPSDQVSFDQEGAEGQQRGDAKEKRTNDGPMVSLPSIENKGDVDDKQNSMDPAGPMDELGFVCHVFEGHRYTHQDQEG